MLPIYEVDLDKSHMIARLLLFGQAEIPCGERSFAHKRFIQLIQRFNPDYGSITVEWGLETPSELAARSSTPCFYNCYLSHAIMEGLSIPTSAYIEVQPNGMYISGYEYFNPTGKTMSPTERDLFSGKVAKKITRLS